MDNMNPQDLADFSKLRCWFFSVGPRDTSMSTLFEGLSMISEDILVPTAFLARLRMACFGPHSLLPKGSYPDVMFTVSKEASALVKFVKQQSPTTFVISLHAAHPYADLNLMLDDIQSPAAIGLVRGHLLRHLNTMH